MKYKVPGNMFYLLRVLWAEDKQTFGAMCLHIAMGAVVPFIGTVIPSLIIRLLVGNASMTTYILGAAGLFLVYGIIQGGLDYLHEYNNWAFIRTRCLYFTEKIYKHRSSLDLGLLEDAAHKKILEDACESVGGNTIGIEGMYHQFITFFMALLGLVLYGITGSFLSPWLMAALLALVAVQYGCFSLAKKYEYSHRGTLDGYLMEAKYLNMIAYDPAAGKDIRLYQLQEWIDAKFKQVNRLITQLKSKDYGAYMLADTVTLILDTARDIICYGFLIHRLMEGMSIDQFVFYLGIISGFSLWFKKVGDGCAQLSLHNVLTGRMRQAMEIKNQMHHGDGEKLTGKAMTISFDHVSFAYPNQKRMILDDVSFTLKAGGKLALVGVNGAGKSTIVKLILGFYAPTKGRITVNGIDTRELDLDDYYGHITGIFQDSKVMSYTIAENVSMCDLDDTDLKRVRDCLRRAGLWEQVAALEKRELTYLFKDIEPDGIQLSGGQLQKLFMARALYHSFDCLLLDEPTAALDAIAEKELYERFDGLTAGKSCLFISHRLSSTRFCDDILVLDQGKIVEQGSHEALLAGQGIYKKMFQAQAKYYAEEGEADACPAGN